MDASLQMQFEILALVTEELAMIYYDANFFRQEVRGGPESPVLE
jgi:hypothetical protein